MHNADSSAEVCSLHLDGDVRESKLGAQQLCCLCENDLSVHFFHCEGKTLRKYKGNF